MATRYLALPALAGALLGASVAAFAQSAAPPAGGDAPPYAAAPAASAAQPNGTQPNGARPNASGSGTHRRHRRGPMARALKGLALTPDQRSKIRGFMQEYRASRGTATPESHAQLRARIESILTPDERTRFETRLQRMANRATNVPPSRAATPGTPPPS